ncbi:MAG: CRISPR system precrRNA processing endoribonuclease RAMP protein Cas6 [Bryobacteraceae bacterium]
MTALHVLPLRFHLEARQPIYFPPGKASNVLRGGFGRAFRSIACAQDCSSPITCNFRLECPYARIFEPRLDTGPSGLADAPRPFLFRASHLDGLRIAPNRRFHFDLHLFDLRPQIVAYFVSAFHQFAETGIGPAGGAAHVATVSILDAARRPVGEIYSEGVLRSNVPCPPVAVALLPPVQPINSVSVRFLTPTELRKNQPASDPPPFAFLLSRLRDRISNLLTLYGPGKPDFDFAGLSARAQTITVEKSSLTNQVTSRYSGRSAQEHPIGGFLGTIDYAGDLSEFLPFLQAGEWTGVGRHTVWGNGQMEIRT